MKRAFLILLLVVLYALHQDFWFWRTARPLLFGFLPAGIWYHVGFTLAVSLVMGLLIQQAWPAHLEEEVTQVDNLHHDDQNEEGEAR
jgi:hypothetical protein